MCDNSWSCIHLMLLWEKANSLVFCKPFNFIFLSVSEVLRALKYKMGPCLPARFLFFPVIYGDITYVLPSLRYFLHCVGSDVITSMCGCSDTLFMPHLCLSPSCLQNTEGISFIAVTLSESTQDSGV